MTIPLIQQPGPFQQLQAAVEAIQSRRQAQQALALQQMLGQAQIQRAQAETAAIPSEIASREAAAGYNVAAAEEMRSRTEERRRPRPSTAQALQGLTGGTPDDQVGRIASYVDLVNSVPDLTAENRNILFNRYVMGKTDSPVDVERIQPWLSLIDRGFTAGQAAATLGLDISSLGVPGTFVHPRYRGLRTAATGAESWDAFMRRNQGQVLNWTRPAVDPDTGVETPAVAPEAAQQRAREFWVASLRVPHPSANLSREQLRRQAQTHHARLRRLGATDQEIEQVLSAARWLEPGPPTPR